MLYVLSPLTEYELISRYLTADKFPICKSLSRFELGCKLTNSRSFRYHWVCGLFVNNTDVRFYRYLWYIIRLAAWAAYRPIP